MKKTKLSMLLAGIFSVSISGLVSSCDANNNASNDSGAVKISPSQLVECYGVSKSGEPLTINKSLCDKLPATKQVAVNPSDYVQCYGVAAAGKNDCGTRDTSCGGKVYVDRSPGAWVSMPKGICENLKGSALTDVTSPKAD